MDIINKIKNLLSLSASANEHEANVALSKAYALIAKYKVTEQELKDKRIIEKPIMHIGRKDFCILNILVHLSKYLSFSILTKKGGYNQKNTMFLVGYEEDLHIAEQVIEKVLSHSRKSYLKYRSKVNTGSRKETEDLKRGYYKGYVSSMVQEIEEKKTLLSKEGIIPVEGNTEIDKYLKRYKYASVTTPELHSENKEAVSKGSQDAKEIKVV